MFVGVDEVQRVIKAGVKWRGEVGGRAAPFETCTEAGRKEETSQHLLVNRIYFSAS